ncbi:MAG: hypothetical protein VKL23_05525, partial [Cyanobacteriota bacterium]|nr:hypothetical protein [Cyanobacteriota bacterium]
MALQGWFPLAPARRLLRQRRLRQQLLTRLLLPLLPGMAILGSLPALASSLGAWRISPQGALELRTSPDVAPQAFY